MSDESPWRPPSGDEPKVPLAPPEPAADSVIDSSDGSPVTPVDAAIEPRRSEPDALLDIGPDQPIRSRASRFGVAALVVGVLAVGAAGVFAVSRLTGRASAGGAESPEELGLELLASLENEDALGVADLLLPGERDMFRDPLVDIVGELTRLDILSADADLAAISGLEVVFEDETVRVRDTNVADIANLTMGADATVSIDGADLPIGDLLDERLPDDMMEEIRGTSETQTDTLDLSMTAVARNGRWYLSLLYTAAEAAREELTDDVGVPFAGVGSAGSDTPEGAIDGLLEQVEAISITGLIRALNPGEAEALQRYAPLFLDEAESAVAEVVEEADFTWRVTDRQFRLEGSGAERTVFFDGIRVEGEAKEATFLFTFADGCTTIQVNDETTESCLADVDPLAEFEELVEGADELIDLVNAFIDAFDDVEPAGLELRRFDGAWYVSPVASGSEAILNVLRALDSDELERIIDAVGPAIERSEDLVAELGEMTVDEAAVDVNGDGDAVAGGGWEVCFDVVDVDEAASCFDDFVQSGEIDMTFVPIALRLRECGYAELAWGDDLYDLDDDAFIAAVESVRPCVIDAAARAGIEDWELPSEITHLGCFEGRNWYQVFDDADYDARFADCVEGPPTPIG